MNVDYSTPGSSGPMGSTKAFFYDFKGIPGFKEDFMGLVQAFFLSNLWEMQDRFLIKTYFDQHALWCVMFTTVSFPLGLPVQF